MTALLGPLAPLSMTETLSPVDTVITLGGSTTSDTFDTAQSGGVYTIAVLDLDEFKKQATHNVGDAMLISYEGASADDTTSHAFSIGRGTHGGYIPLRCFDNQGIDDTPSGMGWYIILPVAMPSSSRTLSRA